MIRQNKTKLQFILAGILMLSFGVTACNNSGDTKETPKDSVGAEQKVVTPPPPPVVKDSNDTMEKTPGKVSPTPDKP